MGTLQDGLRKTGLVSSKQLCEQDAARFLAEEAQSSQNARPVKEKEKRLGILNETSSPDTFRREARKLLLSYPELVQDILNIAHKQGMHQKKSKGGGRLIANLYQVKDALQKNGLSDEEKKHVVEKQFSKK